MTKKILLIDDNEYNTDILSRRLTKKGFAVEVAVNGQDGLDKTSAFKPDLIILDMTLPLISGWDVAQMLKQATETKEIPIIALTAHAMAGDKAKTLQAGCDEYEMKPVEFPRLLEKIQRYLPEK